MVGIHWRAPGESGSGRRSSREFGPWRPARRRPRTCRTSGATSSTSAPAGGSAIPGGRPARWIQYRTSGRVTRSRTYFVDSPVTEADRTRAVSTRTAATSAAAQAAGGAAFDRPAPGGTPTRRSSATHRRSPSASASRSSITRGSNSYSAAESAAIVRGIQRYHVRGNGWDDIGYNFLVDKYGRVFEGRGGGMTRTWSAPTQAGSTPERRRRGDRDLRVDVPLDRGRRALQRLLAWRLTRARPSPRFLGCGAREARAGPSVTRSSRADLGPPGHEPDELLRQQIYGLLGASPAESRDRPPQALSPEADGSVGGPVRFTARLSEALPWTVEVKDAAGTVVAFRQRQRRGRRLDVGRERRSARLLYVHHQRRPNVRRRRCSFPGLLRSRSRA